MTKTSPELPRCWVFHLAPASGSQLTGVNLSCGQGRCNVSRECGKFLGLGSLTSEVRFHLGLFSALLPGAPVTFFDLLGFYL